MPKIFFIILVCVSWRLSSGLAGAAEINPPLGVEANAAFEATPFLTESIHAKYTTLPPDWQTASGALRLNLEWEADHSKPWFIEYQLQGGRFVVAGLALQDKDVVRWGLKIIEWGFSRMEADGAFAHPDCYHSASFFIESSAHGLLLLSASPWKDEFAPRIEAIKPKLLAAARWMVRPDIHALNWPDDTVYPKITGERRYAHRRYLDAAAVGLAGVLCDDKELVEKSAFYIHNGIAFQWPDGVNPERDGHDTAYQAVGLMYACRYYQIVADEPLRNALKPMLEKGFAWMITRIKPDGDINTDGNTRTGPAAELSRTGKPKGQDYPATLRSLSHWTQFTGDTTYQAAAQRVADFLKQAPKP